MATVSERARELAKKVYTYHMEDVNDVCELDIGNLHEWFEQALLAERRLAMGIAIEKVLAFGGYGSQEDAEELAELLRAAAEREVK